MISISILLGRICGNLLGPRKWKKLILGGLTCLILLYMLVIISVQTSVDIDSNNYKILSDSNSGIRSFFEVSFFKSENFTSNTSNIVEKLLVVDTPTCKIPLSDLMPDFYKNNWNWRSEDNLIPVCDQEMKLYHYVLPDELIKVTYPDILDCTLREIIRDPDIESDKEYKEGKELKLTKSRYIDVTAMEMFMVVCNGYYNFEANLPVKAEVTRKLEYWKTRDRQNYGSTRNTPGDTEVPETEVTERPISILWMGIDSTSRRHMHRSFPKTLKLLKEMGFIDFQGFHSIAPNTLDNLIPMKMGYTHDELREKCQDSWETPFDDCPFIWKHFHERNYVTGYIEDWSGSFHWGDGGGFIIKPMDYYIHPLFLAHKKQKENNTGETTDCISTETQTQFMLRYTERFLQKFNSTPSFMFMWISNPVHEYEFALPNMDADYADFFLKISKDSNYLENTLILLHSDHGDRYGLFSSKSVEGFLERSLPPMYMRIPEKLIQKFPHLQIESFAKSNSKLLVTPFDVHHTLLHILALGDKTDLTEKPTTGSGSGSGSMQTQHNNSLHEPQLNNYEPVLADRSSLFAVIPENRTCDSQHISKVVCACNVNKSPTPVQDTFKLTRMVDYAVGELNGIVKNSVYKDNCDEWESEVESLISADILEESGNSSLVLLKFEINEESLFEVKLRVTRINEADDLVETEGELVRISTYRYTSWCVREDTEQDKRMKDYCLCKGEKPEAETDSESTPAETQLSSVEATAETLTENEPELKQEKTL